jgi:hypothetical protein
MRRCFGHVTAMGGPVHRQQTAFGTLSVPSRSFRLGQSPSFGALQSRKLIGRDRERSTVEALFRSTRGDAAAALVRFGEAGTGETSARSAVFPSELGYACRALPELIEAANHPERREERYIESIERSNRTLGVADLLRAHLRTENGCAGVVGSATNRATQRADRPG